VREVSRLIDTFRIGAEESVGMSGEVQNLEIAPRAKGYRGMFNRVPIGLVAETGVAQFAGNLWDSRWQRTFPGNTQQAYLPGFR